MSSFRRQRTVTRYTEGGEYVSGNFIAKGSPTTFTIMASCQPATERDLVALPEGRRSEDTYVLFTSTELYTAEVSGSKNPDIVSLFGEDYEVIGCGRWQNSLKHYRALVVKKEQ
jgi:hypothetical protein